MDYTRSGRTERLLAWDMGYHTTTLSPAHFCRSLFPVESKEEVAAHQVPKRIRTAPKKP